MYDIENWSADDFLCFMLLYAAHADQHFDPSEKEAIIQRCGPATFEKMNTAFLDLDEFGRFDAIGSYLGEHVDSDAKREQILKEVKVIFDADGEYSEVEQGVMKMLESIL